MDENNKPESPFVANAKVLAVPDVERRPRNAAATRERILNAAIAEFAEHGFSGARMDAIAQRSESNMRMLYHYYGSKEDMYLVVLEQVYSDIRHREELLSLDKLAPEQAMLKLFDFTYSYFADHPEVVSLWSGENMLRGRFLSKSNRAAEISSPLLTLIETTLKRGEENQIFRAEIDPLQLYVSMVALSYFHLSNAYTLSAIFSTNLHSKKWKSERKRHATDMLMSYLRPIQGVEVLSGRAAPDIPESSRFRLRNCTLPACFAGDADRLIDITVDSGVIAAITPAGLDGNEPTIDLASGIVWPCFADLHTHLDKGYIWPRAHDTDGTFFKNLDAVARDRDTRWTANDVRTRMAFGLRSAYAHGTKAIRTHIDSNAAQADISWGVFRELRAEWKDRIALQAVSLVPLDDLRDADATEHLAVQVKASSGIFGAFIYSLQDLDAMLDRLFELATRHHLDLDLHVDETDNPAAKGLHAVAAAALRNRFEGRIVCGHCCSLALHSEFDIDQTLDLVAAAGIAIVSLPLTNLHMQDRRSGRTPRWRGITLLHEFATRGIPVALANDNVRDPFYAYGDYDMLELFRIATLTGQLDYPADAWPAAVTTTPAVIMGQNADWLSVGQTADMILLRARSHDELICRPQSDRIVLRKGRRVTDPLPDFREFDILDTH